MALLLARFGSVTPVGTLTVAVSEMEPVADVLMVPVGLTSDSPDWGLFFYLSFEHPFVRTSARE